MTELQSVISKHKHTQQSNRLSDNNSLFCYLQVGYINHFNQVLTCLSSTGCLQHYETHGTDLGFAVNNLNIKTGVFPLNNFFGLLGSAIGSAQYLGNHNTDQALSGSGQFAKDISKISRTGSASSGHSLQVIKHCPEFSRSDVCPVAVIFTLYDEMCWREMYTVFLD